MPANMKKPMGKKADWPPKNYGYAMGVGSFADLNWWSVAWAVGRDNPWDLIIFNFETEDPREVNYYLKEYVGCKLLNGSNYIFYDAKPGIIYIPPPSWRPPPKYKKGSSRRDYTDYLAKRVADIDRKGARVCPWVNYGSHVITHFDLLSVAKYVESKRIKSIIAPEIELDNDFGQYLSDSDDPVNPNTFVFRREPRHASIDDFATVVHESVHAAFDARKEDIYISTNELIAHALESIIAVRLFRKQVKQRLSSDPPRDDHAVWFFGWAVNQNAQSKFKVDLEQHNTDVEDPFKGVDVKPLNTLISYLYSKRTYRRKWRKKVHFDGI